MTLPTSGPLSINDIAGEFGGTAPHSMNEYYAGGGLVPAGASGTYGAVPSSGQISIQNFYGTAAQYQISRSLRFNSADSTNLTRAPAVNGTRTTWTLSLWVKRSQLGSRQDIFGIDNSNVMSFNSSDILYVECYNGVGADYYINSAAVYRDPSAWYHIVWVWDSTNATAANRQRLYVNGSSVPIGATGNTIPSGATSAINGTNTHSFGRNTTGGFYFNGYMTEINFIDGQALTPSSFGQTNADTGVWEPIGYSGSYGTNGFYINFSDNSNTTAATLGKDYSGNSNNWTPNNFSVAAGAGNDSLVDTPTNYGTDTGAGGEVRGNYCTLNSLAKSTNVVLYQGNLQCNSTAGSYNAALGTIGSNTGKYYFEMTLTGSMVAAPDIGWHQSEYTTAQLTAFDNNVRPGGYCIATDGTGTANIFSFNNGTKTTIANSGWVVGDTIGCAIDMDAKKLWFHRNGTWYPASVGGGAGNPSAGTNPTITYTYSNDLLPRTCAYSGGYESTVNFGQRPFAYTAPSGFKALCTENLPTPTVLDGGDYFNAVLWTGNNTASQAITGVGFQPDLVWAKSRPANSGQDWVDAVRGATKNIQSSSTNAETTSNTVISFQSDGFTVGDGLGYDINKSGESVVGWCWKANGAGSSNTAGATASTVSANTTSGCSIVTFTGTGSTTTVGHGLGIKPGLMIFKSRNNAGGAADWMVYHSSLGATKNLRLQSTVAQDTQTAVFNDTEPTTTVFTVGTNNNINASGGTMLAYCFAPIAGYSAFGSYTGNGSTDGPFIYTGFTPRWILMKYTNTTSYWLVMDTTRSPYNVTTLGIQANSTAAESSGLFAIDIVSNGFKPRDGGGLNGSGNTTIYAAFAENPFKYSRAR